MNRLIHSDGIESPRRHLAQRPAFILYSRIISGLSTRQLKRQRGTGTIGQNCRFLRNVSPFFAPNTTWRPATTYRDKASLSCYSNSRINQKRRYPGAAYKLVLSRFLWKIATIRNRRYNHEYNQTENCLMHLPRTRNVPFRTSEIERHWILFIPSELLDPFEFVIYVIQMQAS